MKTKKSNRKLEYTAIVILVVLVVAFVFLMKNSSNICSNGIHKEIYSPDRSLKAVIFTRNCGATTNYSTQVSIIEKEETLKNESGNVYIVDGQALKSSPKISWVDKSHLNIKPRPYKRELKAEKEWGWIQTVKISYDEIQ